MQQTNENNIQSTNYYIPQGPTKFCKKCKGAIAKQAVICPMCRTKQTMGNDLLIALSAVGAILILLPIAFFSIISEAGSTENQTAIVSESTPSDEEENAKAEKDLITEEETESQKINFDDFAEEDYKEQCKEMFYDDVFFSGENFVGEYVKLHLLLSEKYFFTADAMYNDTIKTLHDENNLYRDYYKSCVLREGTNSYVGQQIYVFFSEDYEIKPEDYKTGQKIMMYGEIIHCVTNTWDGYNQVCFMPKYTEKE